MASLSQLVTAVFYRCQAKLIREDLRTQSPQTSIKTFSVRRSFFLFNSGAKQTTNRSDEHRDSLIFTYFLSTMFSSASRNRRCQVELTTLLLPVIFSIVATFFQHNLQSKSFSGTRQIVQPQP